VNQGAGSRDKVKHIERNDQLFVTIMTSRACRVDVRPMHPGL